MLGVAIDGAGRDSSERGDRNDDRETPDLIGETERESSVGIVVDRGTEYDGDWASEVKRDREGRDCD